MYLHTYKIKNFRRLNEILVELEQDISIYVGGNNSGKTSSTHLVQLFVAGSKDKLSIHDFSVECWGEINSIGKLKEEGKDTEAIAQEFPKITLDLWFSVGENDLSRVIDLLPSLEWVGSKVGLRISLEPLNVKEMLDRYSVARMKVPSDQNGKPLDYWPKDLFDYLRQNFSKEFEFKYYALDESSFDSELNEQAGYEPAVLSSERGRSGPQITKSILKVDCLDAQRHLSDNSASRSENLSKCLSRFYSRNFKKKEDDPEVQEALSRAKAGLDSHFEKIFGPTLGKLGEIGYPGLGNPKLMIKSALNPSTIMSSQDGATVHYALEKKSGGTEDGHILPDRYNGLGFKNLIYMVIELLDLHAQWLDPESEENPPLHLVFIEEPEAHLHTQLQQVFVRKVLDILALEDQQKSSFFSQLVITTHSPHILFERGFRPIRYFRKTHKNDFQVSEVLNLSKLYEGMTGPDRGFLERYMKLVHCDLFFADAAVLVEGNVERLLMPLMIQKAAKALKSSSLSILEIGGAFGYRFQKLIEYLGITTLIVTDLDSVTPVAEDVQAGNDTDDEESEVGKACPVLTTGAVTTNQNLIQWLPRMNLVSELLSATDDQKTQLPSDTSPSLIRVVYQKPRVVSWNTDSAELVGRTFEEDFAYENLAWCQNEQNKNVHLFIAKNTEKSLTEMSEKIFRRVKGSGFGKTDFALAVLEKDPLDWQVPKYLDEGLKWLEDQLVKQVKSEVISEAIVAESVAVTTEPQE